MTPSLNRRRRDSSSLQLSAALAAASRGALMGLCFMLVGCGHLPSAFAQQIAQPYGPNGIACAYNATSPTLTTANAGWVQCDSLGRLLTTSTPSGAYFTNVASTTLTRVANSTTYTANTTVCAAASITACTPLTIAIGSSNASRGLITRLSLLKSSSTTTNASFIVWLFSAAPGVATPAQYDNVAYTGPRAADMPNYIGSATCATPIATSDTSAQVWYECSLNNPNTAGALVFQSLTASTNINALISVTAAYAPASAETFNVYISGVY